jgi:hypothetical protein
MALARRRLRLRVVRKPDAGDVLNAPADLEFGTKEVSYLCGHCGMVLLLGDANLTLDATIKCSICRAYNATG